MSYAFFWVIPRRLNSYAGELPRRKHTTFLEQLGEEEGLDGTVVYDVINNLFCLCFIRVDPEALCFALRGVSEEHSAFL